MNGDDLRARLAKGTPVLMPGVWDALSARLVAQAGFDTAFVSGFCVSGTRLGVPDFGYLTQTEMAETGSRVAASSPELMVLIDADTGYGNALNVRRTVELYETAGAVGLFLEDQVWPKKCGHMAGKQVVPRDEWLTKLRAAVDSRTHLHITARTDARAAVDLADAIDRAKAAADLGVDALFVEAPQSMAELEQIARELAPFGLTLVANMVEKGQTPLLTPRELHELGFSLIATPLSLMFAATKAMRDVLAVLHRHGTTRDNLSMLVPFDEFGAIVDLDGHYAREAQYR
ncbi:MAG TPA: isocitrate lyase/PEP mutase family protein [Acidimicrobiales bacterium]|nr:isocitrate lyase/PEP mutase family protein [Acidimicrobiales bacterium]